MHQSIPLPSLQTEYLFSVPIWRSRIPALYKQHEQIKADILADWEAGSYRRHAHGYGYQTPADIFDPESLQTKPYFKSLKQAFVQNVTTIIRRRQSLAACLPFAIEAVRGWVLVQTSDEWVNGPWHDHYPAVVSGCYYLQVPATDKEKEGALSFQRPSPQDMFVEHWQHIKPIEGEFILFPSSLMHRPEPCPSASELRITIAMDAYVKWIHPHAEDKGAIPQDEYNEMIVQSLE